VSRFPVASIAYDELIAVFLVLFADSADIASISELHPQFLTLIDLVLSLDLLVSHYLKPGTALLVAVDQQALELYLAQGATGVANS
jgi:hypothetical protein